MAKGKYAKKIGRAPKVPLAYKMFANDPNPELETFRAMGALKASGHSFTPEGEARFEKLRVKLRRAGAFEPPDDDGQY